MKDLERGTKILIEAEVIERAIFDQRKDKDKGFRIKVGRSNTEAYVDPHEIYFPRKD